MTDGGDDGSRCRVIGVAAHEGAEVVKALHLTDGSGCVVFVGEEQLVTAYTPGGGSDSDSAVAPAWCVLVDEATMLGHEVLKSRSSSARPLAEGGGSDVTDERGVLTGKVKDVGQHVCEAVISVEAEEHSKCAAELDLFGQQVRVGCSWVGLFETFMELAGEQPEVQVLAFDSTLPPIEDVVGRDAVRPGTERSLSSVRADARHDPDECLLRGVLRVVGMPEHAQREPIDVVLQRDEHRFERASVATTGGRSELTQLGVA
jgi:hypothetical protein